MGLCLGRWGLSRGACPPRGGLLAARFFDDVERRNGSCDGPGPDRLALVL